MHIHLFYITITLTLFFLKILFTVKGQEGKLLHRRHCLNLILQTKARSACKLRIVRSEKFTHIYDHKKKED